MGDETLLRSWTVSSIGDTRDGQCASFAWKFWEPRCQKRDQSWTGSRGCNRIEIVDTQDTGEWWVCPAAEVPGQGTRKVVQGRTSSLPSSPQEGSTCEAFCVARNVKEIVSNIPHPSPAKCLVLYTRAQASLSRSWSNGN
jgi:hypothetical protein